MDFRFELPLDMNTLAGMEPVDFLARHVTVTTSRRQLYDKVKLESRASHENFKHEFYLDRCSHEIEVQEMAF